MTTRPTAIAIEAIPVPLREAISAIAGAARDLARLIARGHLNDSFGHSLGASDHGDDQKALDVIADEAFIAAMKGTGVRWLASEERPDVLEIDAGGTLALAIDPLDGSSNIDVNVSIGTIFGIRPAGEDAMATILAPGNRQIAAGYVIYGPQTQMIVTFGAGVQQYLLDPDSARFELLTSDLRVPTKSSEFAINASNYRHWTKPIRAYIDDCLAGAEGPRAKDFNMRWVASLVAEAHRILTRGGIFLYPGDSRKGYERGRLRMVYECAPMAMLVEQAGGRATDGCDPILNQVPQSLHARSPLVFGTAEKVDRVAAYHDLPEGEVSALFGSRGLFRV